VVAIDLGYADAAARIEAELREAGEEPQFVVNNAGFGLLGPAASLDREEQVAMIDLNARVLTDLSLRFVDSLARHKGGILNVASVASFMPGPGMAVYHATKAYVLSFSEALHRELKRNGVRVTALCPGPVETEFQSRAGMPEGYFPRFLARTAERVAREGYDGLMRGKRVVVPGSDNKVAALLPRLLPRWLVLTIMRGFGRNR
jgi:short-subunit dehydrogenase